MIGQSGEASKKNEVIQDHNSPYYIHTSDYPRKMHVSETLANNNYFDWFQEMINYRHDR